MWTLRNMALQDLVFVTVQTIVTMCTKFRVGSCKLGRLQRLQRPFAIWEGHHAASTLCQWSPAFGMAPQFKK